MRIVACLALIITAIIHLIPVVGLVGASRLESLYGIAVQDPNLEILLRHRAVLFGIIGAILLYGAFYRPFRFVAITFGLISVISFMLITFLVGDHNDKLQTVFTVDLVALCCLIAGGIAAMLE